MNNAISAGTTKRFTATADVRSGQLIASGVVLGVAITDVSAGQQGTAKIEGVFNLPKAIADAIPDGAPLTFDAQTGRLTVATATAGDVVGGAVAMEPAVANSATVAAKLCPGVGVLQA